MTFALSKIVAKALAPDTLALALLALGLLCLRRRPRLARGLLLLDLALLSALNFCPVAHWVSGPLERRFPEQPLPAQVDGIIVLGGGINPEISRQHQAPALDAAAARVTEAMVLARRFPQARLVYSGGTGSLRDPDDREADAVRPLFEAMGINDDRVIYERDSRNTWENAVDSKRLANPQPGQVWLLVTSAFHMPRAVGCFRKAGWEVLPHPVDFRSSPQWFGWDLNAELGSVAVAEKEWIGLFAYHLLGRTDTWFPAPRGAAGTR